MPTIRNIPGPHRFFFHSFDCGEPPHVHVRRDANQCKFWLAPVRVASIRGFSDIEIRRIERTILRERPRILEAWYEHCRAASR